MARLTLPRSARPYVLGGVACLAIAVLAFYWYRGGTPIAIVNGSPITSRRLVLNYQSAAAYFEHAKKAYQTDGEKNIDPNELRAEVLTRLIESELIEDGLKQEAGSDVGHLLEAKLARYENNAELQKAATVSYSMTYRDFWNEVIVPQAKRDILAGRLFLRGEGMDEWITRAKRDASVAIFVDGFKWSGARVEVVR
jgi:hypothetical protein